ncbi:hypothetical protein SSX86_017410 [Deinandra increscens subsp. villosa]|uniref:CG-1 domain-containing protein n=1 Tax=Deinandra increscens subsp. villosa TaxID=3103831 RepID=A0AAP0GYI4_9ASTR
MEIVRSQKKVAASSAAAASNGVSTLPLYRSAPTLEVRLEEFERFAVDRLLVLRGISDGLARGKKPDEMEKLVKDLWKANMRHPQASEDINKDIISHFVLRLVYCRSEELRKWFLSMESTLFRYRFRENPNVHLAVMAELGIPYKVVSQKEFEDLRDNLNSVARSISQPLPTSNGLYKVSFEQVPELVASRRVFIQKGYAYVALNQVVSFVVPHFRSHLSKALVLTNRKWTSMIREQEKDRLTPIVEALATSYLGPDYSQDKEVGEISLKDIDQVARTSFPLCMQHLFSTLRDDHHLKHGGRMQLGLFLKGVGLKLDDALAFWKAEFSQKVGTERFDKEYAYGIRHNYGKEGKRTDYTPYSCQKIILSTPGVGDHHGCPYRHFSEENLRAALGKMGVSSRALEDVIEKAKSRHYQLACTLTFEALHDSSCDAGINHPNQYFSDSQKILKEKVVMGVSLSSGAVSSYYAVSCSSLVLRSYFGVAKLPAESESIALRFSRVLSIETMTSGYDVCDLVHEAQIRWLKPGEVLFILQNFEENQLTHEPPQKPPSGALFLFNKRVLRFFRKDGHSWRRKKDGRTVGEAHEHLKVGNVQALNCYYAHGEVNPNFQRRSYWMLDSGMDHIVLVHYRDITMNAHSPGSVSTFSTGSPTLIEGSNSYASQFTQSAAAFNNFHESYDNTSSPSSIEFSSDVVTKSNGTSPLSCTEGFEESGGSPNFEVDQALRRIKEQLSLDEENLKDLSAFYSENEISNESGFSVDEQDYGEMQDGSNNYASEQYPGGYVRPDQCRQQSNNDSCITNQQTSYTNNVSKDNGKAIGVDSQKNFVYPSDRNGVLLSQSRRDPVELQEKYNSGYTGPSNNSCALLLDELEDFKFPTYTPTRSLSGSYPNIYSTMFDEGQGISLESDSRFAIEGEQKFTIREIAPEWGYASEPTKVLIIGTFTRDLTKRQWYCMFGETEVPAEIIQEGVLCCYAPTCLPGKVAICITSGNQESCSEIREFEYRDKPYNYTNKTEAKSRNSEELLLLVRFMYMLLSGHLSQNDESLTAGDDSWSQVIETLLDGSLESSNATDWLLEELLKDKLQIWLSSRLQNKKGVTDLSKREQGIIHMISGLGFGWALTPILKSGVGVNFRDINGWTALHWAARFGREKMVAELLASGASAGAVTDPSQLDPTGQTPASLAATCGHKGLAGYLSEISLTSHPSLQLQQTELSRSSADIDAETAAVNSISKLNLVTNEDLSLKDTLAAVRNATQAAAHIQSAFRAHSFRKRQQKESYVRDEYGILLSDIEGLPAASKLASRNRNYHNAALSIQKKYRGWKGRKDFLALRQKVVKIQALVRGHQVRKSYKVFCWAVGVVEKVVLRWRRKGVGLRGYKQELGAIDQSEDEDIVKVFRKEKVDVSIDEAVSRVLSMVDSQPARQQYRRMLQKYQQAKAEREASSTSQGDVMNM